MNILIFVEIKNDIAQSPNYILELNNTIQVLHKLAYNQLIYKKLIVIRIQVVF